MANPSLSYTISDRLLIMQVCKKQVIINRLIYSIYC